MSTRGSVATAFPHGLLSKGGCMNVKVDADIVRMAKVVAAVKNITLSRYITDLVRSQVESDLAEVAAGLAEPFAPSTSSPTSDIR